MEKTILGQAWIFEDKLIQEQILLLSNGSTSTNQVAIISDIWDNLVNGGDAKYPVKTNDKKNYFYWEYDMNDTLDDTIVNKIKIECPMPKEGLFTAPYDPTTGKTDWAKYWLTKYQDTEKNAEVMKIQKTEYTLPGTKRLDFSTGQQTTTEEIKIENNDIGDITNLLSMF